MDEYIHNWNINNKYSLDDESDYYMEDDEDKWVIMPTEDLFDDGSDDDEPNSEKKVNDDEIPLPSWLRKPRPRPTIRFGQTGGAGGGSGIGAGKIRPTIRLGGSSGRTGVRMEPSELHKSADQPLRDPKGGLTAAGRRHFKETEGANLKPGVTGAADTPTKMRRKGSFLVRFFTNPRGPMVDEKGRPTRLALSAHAWGEPVPKNLEDAAKLAAKGRRLLDRYRAQQEKSKGQKSFEQFQLSLKQSDARTDSSGDVNFKKLQSNGGSANKNPGSPRDAADRQRGREFLNWASGQAPGGGSSFPSSTGPLDIGKQGSRKLGQQRMTGVMRMRGWTNPRPRPGVRPERGPGWDGRQARPTRGPGWSGTRPRSGGNMPKPTYRVTPSINGRRQPSQGSISQTLRGQRDSLGRNVVKEPSYTGSPGGNAPRRNTPSSGKYQVQPALGRIVGKSFDMPGRSHGGVAPRVPKGSWTGSPGGTTHGGDYRHLPRTASGRKQKTFVRGQNREEAYPKDKYFLIGNDGQPVRRRLK